MLRTTLIRGGLLALLALFGAAIWYAQSYVHPDAVRASLLQSFEQQFPGSQPKIDEAHYGVFSGVSVHGLALTRPEDGQPFFTAPRAMIAHDKEKLSGGNMVIRKIELEAPTLRLERRADGRWTFDGLAKPAPADKPVPTFVVTNGTITIVDKSPAGLPPLTLTAANFTLLNDPPPLFLNVKGTANLNVDMPGAPLPPVRVEISGRLHRLSGEFQFRVTAIDLAVGPELCGLLRRWRPGLAETLATLTAKATVRADLAYKPEAPSPLTYDLEVKLKEGRFTDSRLPVPVETLEATARYRDGRLSIEKATAKLGTCTAELSAEARPQSNVQLIPPAASGGVPATLAKSIRANSLRIEPDALADLEQHFDRLDLTFRDLTLSDELFDRFGEKAMAVRDRFQPAGVVAVNYRFSRPAATGWRREFELKPTKFRMTYDRFRYPLDNVGGFVRRCVTNAGLDETVIDLTGTGGGQRVDIKGTVSGTGPDPGIDLKITGTNVPLNDQFFEALPKVKHQEALKKLRAGGRGDFVAEVKQEAGVNLTHTYFRLQISGGRLNHRMFAYPLEDVSGLVTVSITANDPTRPLRLGQPFTELPDTDRIELCDFRGRHGDGLVSIKGAFAAVPGEADRKLTMTISGQNCPIDSDMKAALAGLKLDAVWRTFSPRGKITFAVDVECLDRVAALSVPRPLPLLPVKPPGVRGMLTARPKAVADDPPFNPATDLTLTLHFTGPSITPDFFPYDLDQVAGRVRYDGVQVRVEKVTAKHGPSVWSLDAGDVRFFNDGRVWGNFGRLDVAPLVPDEAFVKALPPSLQKGVKDLNLRGPMDMTLRHLVVLTPPDSPPIQQVSTAPAKPVEEPDPDIYWTGELRFHGAALDAGVTWDKIKGRIASTGRYYGTHLGEVVGNIWFDEALVADHPVQRVKIGYRADPQTPDSLRPGEWESVAVKFSDLTGDFFGGQLTGEARVVLSEPVRYKTRLDAVDVRLDDFARHHQLAKTSRFEGLAQASLRLETATDVCGCPMLDGAGTLDIDRAQMLNLPFLLPLLKTLKLQAPDKTAFEEAHASFTVRGDRLHVTHLDLIGDAVSIGGSGETDLAGQHVKFDCYTIWSQTLHRWLTTPFGDVSAFLSEKLFRIEISRGADGKIKYDARLVPFMTDPVRTLAERLKRRSTAGKTELNNRVTEAPKTK